MATEDRDELAKFVGEIHDLLRVTVDRYRDWLPQDLQQRYSAAYRELEGAVDATRRELARADEQLDANLDSAGLTGAQLELKLSGWRRALNRFFNNPGRGFLRRALRWGNVILGSLAGAIGAAETIKEFKETVEAGLEDEAEGAAS